MNHVLALAKTIKKHPQRRLPLAVAICSISSPLMAFETVTFDNGLSLQTQLTANYTLSARTDSANAEYLQDANNDDATRNFDEWGLINNRVSLFGEVIARYGDYGAVIRGSHFYDDVYHQKNDNDSPNTVNVAGDNRRFTDEAKDRSGGEARLLDAYVFGNFTLLEDKYLSVKAGRHIVAWGQSVFLPNISQGQTPVDATKFNVPGTEAKDTYLPVGQVSANLALSQAVTLTGFWQYEWEETLLNPVGDFFGSDFFGPGSEYFRYGPGPLSLATGAPYGGEVTPDDDGQWGVGIRYNPNFNTEFGLFHYRYHDRTPQFFLNATGNDSYSSAPDLGSAGSPNYQFKYFEDIKLTGVSVSTKVGQVQLGGDMSLRQDAPVVLTNFIPTTGDILQTNVNATYIIGPTALAQQTTLLGEFINQRIQSVDTLFVTDNSTATTTAFDEFKSDSFTKSSSAFALGIFLDYSSILQGWDLKPRITWTQNIAGSGLVGFGGRDEKRLTVGADMVYLGNFTAGATLVNYLSSANLDRGRSSADKDYLSFNFKYTF